MRNYQTKSNQGALPDSITSTRFGAGEFNSVAVELEGAVTTSGQTLAPADGTGEVTDQLAMALAIYGAGGATYHIDTGAVNAYVLTPVSPKESPNAYFNGFSVVFEPGTVNTTASTVNVGGLGVKSITLQNGTALTGGEISGTCCLKYNLSDDRFELIYSSDSFLSTSNYYEIDATQADQGATSTNAETYTIYDVATLVGTSKFATIHLSHNPAAGNQTYYTLDTSINLATYPLLYFKVDPGAQLNRTTGDEVFTIYSPENLIVGNNQQITSVDMILFQLGGTVYPEWWGARGDLSTVSTDGIQFAVNSLTLNGGNGTDGIVQLSSGFYVVDGTITIETSFIHLRGAGVGWQSQSGTVIYQTTANTDTLVIGGPDSGTIKQHFDIRDFTIGRSASTDTSGAAITFQHCSSVKMHSIRTYNCHTGLNLVGCTFLLCSRFLPTWTAIPASGGLYGVYVDPAYNSPSLYFNDCNFSQGTGPTVATSYGFYITGDYVHDITIRGCEFSGFTRAIYMNASGGVYYYDIHIEGNVIDSIDAIGIYLVNFGETGTANLTSNWISPSSELVNPDYFSGIYLKDCFGITAVSNTIVGLTNYANTYGIVLDGCESSNIIGNILNACSKGSIYITGASSSNAIMGNNIRGTSTTTLAWAIATGNSANYYNTITGNTISGYATIGIQVLTAASNNIVALNTIDPTNVTTLINDTSTGTIVLNNRGYITEASGTSAAIATGGTIAHGLSATPTVVNLTSTDTGVTAIYWSANATNITVNYTGGGSHAFHWEAKVR